MYSFSHSSSSRGSIVAALLLKLRLSLLTSNFCSFSHLSSEENLANLNPSCYRCLHRRVWGRTVLLLPAAARISHLPACWWVHKPRCGLCRRLKSSGSSMTETLRWSGSIGGAQLFQLTVWKLVHLIQFVRISLQGLDIFFFSLKEVYKHRQIISWLHNVFETGYGTHYFQIRHGSIHDLVHRSP